VQVRPFLNVAGGTIELSDLRGVGGMQVCTYAVFLYAVCVCVCSVWIAWCVLCVAGGVCDVCVCVVCVCMLCHVARACCA
jgi:hypothetical protein